MEDRSRYVLWFQECDLNSISLVGGKNASLGELLKAGIPVPPGFALTTEAKPKASTLAYVTASLFPGKKNG
jgi:pyruvate,water dikinase